MMFWGVEGWWGSLLMILTMLVFWGAIITALVFVIRSFSNTAGPTPGSYTAQAERLLAERFARGEIDEAEYTGRVTALRAATS